MKTLLASAVFHNESNYGFYPSAGVIQVVDFSFKAFETCRELYKDGSLAQHRSTKDITKYMGKRARIQSSRPVYVNDSKLQKTRPEYSMYQLII